MVCNGRTIMPPILSPSPLPFPLVAKNEHPVAVSFSNNKGVQTSYFWTPANLRERQKTLLQAT